MHPRHLIDASVYIFRAWYSLSDEFRSESGHPTNAVYGFTRMLCQFLEKTDALEVGLAFDESLTTCFRNDIYPDYKANRDPAPPELKRQILWCESVAQALGLATFKDSQFEADDIVGTLAAQAQKQNRPVVIVSGDKDLTQLLTDRDRFWDFPKNRPVDSDGVEAKFGVRPEQIADYLALTGDAVDNIPGVPGVGPKTASALLAHFGSLEQLWERLDEVAFLRIRGARTLADRLRTHQDDARMFRRITGIVTEMPALTEPPTLHRQPVQKDNLNRLFDELSFGSFLRQRCLRLSVPES